ncbi:MAG: hypothetical protein K8U03_05985 [Planctomycetia bacterium]|nr:hypothetical protein [Planctomycetia bacterium]
MNINDLMNEGVEIASFYGCFKLGTNKIRPGVKGQIRNLARQTIENKWAKEKFVEKVNATCFATRNAMSVELQR